MAHMAPNPTAVEPMINEFDTTISDSPSSLPQTPRDTKPSWVAGKRNKLLRRIPLFKPPKMEAHMMASTSSTPTDNQHVGTEYTSTQHEGAARSVSPDSALLGMGHGGQHGEGSQSPPPPPSNSQYQYQSVPSPPLYPEQPQSPKEADMGIYPAYPATFPGGFHSYSPPPMAMYGGSPMTPQVINFQNWGQAYDTQSLMSSRMLMSLALTFHFSITNLCPQLKPPSLHLDSHLLGSKSMDKQDTDSHPMDSHPSNALPRAAHIATRSAGWGQPCGSCLFSQLSGAASGWVSPLFNLNGEKQFPPLMEPFHRRRLLCSLL